MKYFMIKARPDECLDEIKKFLGERLYDRHIAVYESYVSGHTVFFRKDNGESILLKKGDVLESFESIRVLQQ